MTRIPAELSHLPRVRGPALINAAEYWVRNDALIDRLSRLGDRFVLTMPGTGAWLCLTNPRDIEVTFRAAAEDVYMAEVVRMLSPHELVLGAHQLTTLDGAEHLHKRWMLLPAFHGDALNSYSATIEEKAREASANWPVDRAVRALPLAQDVALEIIMAVVFGVTDRDRLDRLRKATLELTAHVASRRFLVQMAITNARGDRFQRPFPTIETLKAAVDAVVLEEVAERRLTDQTGAGDVLGGLLTMTDEHGRPMSDEELCDNMRLLLIGGHDTTAATIAWTLERVTHNPVALDRLESAVGAGDDAYVDAVIQETLRMRPIFPFSVRMTKQPLEVEGLVVPAQTIVVPYIALVHRRPEFYPDPDEFRPERFLAARPGTYSWIPFGGGIYRCLGASMAMLEARIVIRTLMEQLELGRSPSAPERSRRQHVTFVPARGAVTTALRRRADDVVGVEKCTGLARVQP
jgi:cytochrome P450 family 135